MNLVFWEKYLMFLRQSGYVGANFIWRDMQHLNISFTLYVKSVLNILVRKTLFPTGLKEHSYLSSFIGYWNRLRWNLILTQKGQIVFKQLLLALELLVSACSYWKWCPISDFCVFFGKSWMLLSVLTGVFPTKVFPIPAREVTLDELQKVSELKLLFASILEAIWISLLLFGPSNFFNSNRLGEPSYMGICISGKM